MRFHEAWLIAIAACLNEGRAVAPRGKATVERIGTRVEFDANAALLVHPARDLNYRFAVAEFLWIANGSEKLEPLARFNSVMRQFSDDGVTLAGAYGPRLGGQWKYVIDTLERDPSSRQAVASIWTPRPEPSRDVPCTISAQFLLRDGELHSVWSMRSNDLWLGLPYDAFSFARLTACVAGELRARPGRVVINAGSSHLYEPHYEKAWDVLRRQREARSVELPALDGFPPYTAAGYFAGSGTYIEHWRGEWAQLEEPWARYGAALSAPSSRAALAALEEPTFDFSCPALNVGRTDEDAA